MLTLTKDLVPFIYVDGIQQGLTKDLPASGSRKARTNTHQRFSKPILSSLRPSHHTHINPGPLQDHHFLFTFITFITFYLISLSYLIADTSARSKQRILKTFAKLAEKADRQPVCTELKQK